MPTTDRRARQIARRRQRIAAQPRAGDMVIELYGSTLTVRDTSCDLVWFDLEGYHRFAGRLHYRASCRRDEWPDMVRRARVTQEGQ